MDIIILSIAGLVGGFVGAQVGGGALITLPALLFVGLDPALAIGTNILSGWLINVTAVARYVKEQTIDFKLTIPISIIATVGAVIGAQLVLDIDQGLLERITAGIFIALIGLLFLKPKEKKEKITKLSTSHKFIGLILSFILGVYGGFFSVSVATLFIFLFVLALGKPLLESVADAVFATAIFLIGALVVFVAQGNIDYSLGIPLAITSVVGSYAGAHTAVRLGEKWIKIILTILVVSITAKLLLGI